MYTVNELYGQPWDAREYIVVLASYVGRREKALAIDSPEVQRLAALLGRTPASILMRMENFASLDETISRRGLIHVNPSCRSIFENWIGRPEELQAVAEFICGELKAPRQIGLFEAPRVRLPTDFSQYELLERRGEGGFGEVYSCLKRSTSELFALKIIRGDKIQDKECLHRFAREMRALKRVNSPCIIRLYEDNLESEERFPAFVMDLGLHSLSEYIQKEFTSAPNGTVRVRPPVDVALSVMRSMLGAVGVLHGLNPPIIHRDINPNNIIQLLDGRWVLADFGLAKFLGSANGGSTFSTYTQKGWGTTYFASPEQMHYFKNTDERSDIYSLGILLWELFSPALPPPRLDKSQLPGPLDDIFKHTANPEYDERYSSIGQFSEEFEAAIAAINWGQEPHAVP